MHGYAIFKLNKNICFVLDYGLKRYITIPCIHERVSVVKAQLHLTAFHLRSVS